MIPAIFSFVLAIHILILLRIATGGATFRPLPSASVRFTSALRTDKSKNLNGQRTDSGRTADGCARTADGQRTDTHGRRTDSGRTMRTDNADGQRTDGGRTADGCGRTADGQRTDSGRTMLSVRIPCADQ